MDSNVREAEAWLRSRSHGGLEQLRADVSRGLPGDVSLTAKIRGRGLLVNARAALPEFPDGAWLTQFMLFADGEPNDDRVLFQRTLVTHGLREKRLGRKIIRNRRDIALNFGIDLIEGQATGAGAYFCARWGLVPKNNVWKRFRELVRTRLEAGFPGLSIPLAERHAVYSALNAPEPFAIQEVARARSLVKVDEETTIPLGRWLLAEPSHSWEGQLNLAEPMQRLILDDYVGESSIEEENS